MKKNNKIIIFVVLIAILIVLAIAFFYTQKRKREQNIADIKFELLEEIRQKDSLENRQVLEDKQVWIKVYNDKIQNWKIDLNSIEKLKDDRRLGKKQDSNYRKAVSFYNFIKSTYEDTEQDIKETNIVHHTNTWEYEKKIVRKDSILLDSTIQLFDITLKNEGINK